MDIKKKTLIWTHHSSKWLQKCNYKLACVDIVLVTLCNVWNATPWKSNKSIRVSPTLSCSCSVSQPVSPNPVINLSGLTHRVEMFSVTDKDTHRTLYKYVQSQLLVSAGSDHIPAKKDHFHVSAGQDLPDSCHLGQITPHLCHLFLCSDWIQFLIAVGLCNTTHLTAIRKSSPAV